MKTKLNKTLATVVITASLMSIGYTALAADAPAADVSMQSPVTYKLTDLLEVELKGVLNERVTDGTRLGVVIRMKNNGSVITRVPEYELRVKTSEGLEYTLQPSASNVKSIQPKANTELSFMSVVDRTDAITLTDVNWTDVDVYVYPKKETLIVSVPVTGQPWKGSDTAITDPTAVKKWSDSFKIPSLTSPIQYTPTAINKESTPQGTVYVVQLLAFNPTDQREALPDFMIDGKADGKVFSGKKVEQETVTLEAKEEKYIHYAIATDQDTVLASLNVLTPEKFAQAGAGAGPTLVNYNVGRLNILLPIQTGGSAYEAYAMGTPMKFDQRSELIHPDMEVSVVEFQMHENKEEGSKNVTAKFKLWNKTDRPIAVPAFQTDLVSSDGYEYSGNRQTITTASVLPNSAFTVSFSYTVPASETGKGLALKIQDTKTAAPYKSTIAAYSLQLHQLDDSGQFSVYPFKVKISDWSIGTNFNRQAALAYTYKAKFFMDITREEQVQVDQNFSRLQFELYDSVGRLIGNASGSFLGTNRLVTGENNLTFTGSSEQFDHPLTIRVYEVFTTAGGEAKRLVGEYKQI